MSYWINITDSDGVLLGQVRLDGMDLRSGRQQQWLGERIADEMGGDAVTACAALPETA